MTAKINNKQHVYVGIDVAFAKKKRLPVCVCRSNGAVLEVLPLRDSFMKPPAGKGNRAALVEGNCRSFAAEVADWLKKLETQKGLVIERIAIDAPRHCAKGKRRTAECSMDERGISCFTTPTQGEFDVKIKEALSHLAAGGKEAEMPNANQIWMLVGFALFRALEKIYDCIEVFPQAIVKAIGCEGEHKSTDDGFAEQLKQFAKAMAQEQSVVLASFDTMGFGGKHDRLDAYLSAWVASLPETARLACGTPPDDVIWVPRDVAVVCGNKLELGLTIRVVERDEAGQEYPVTWGDRVCSANSRGQGDLDDVFRAALPSDFSMGHLDWTGAIAPMSAKSGKFGPQPTLFSLQLAVS